METRYDSKQWNCMGNHRKQLGRNMNKNIVIKNSGNVKLELVNPDGSREYVGTYKNATAAAFVKRQCYYCANDVTSTKAVNKIYFYYNTSASSAGVSTSVVDVTTGTVTSTWTATWTNSTGSTQSVDALKLVYDSGLGLLSTADIYCTLTIGSPVTVLNGQSLAATWVHTYAEADSYVQETTSTKIQSFFSSATTTVAVRPQCALFTGFGGATGSQYIEFALSSGGTESDTTVTWTATGTNSGTTGTLKELAVYNWSGGTGGAFKWYDKTGLATVWTAGGTMPISFAMTFTATS
jgi:hypothetical protein